MLFQLRHHPLPKSEQFENLKNCAKSKGFDVKTSSNKALAETLDRCVDSKDPVINKVSRSFKLHIIMQQKQSPSYFQNYLYISNRYLYIFYNWRNWLIQWHCVILIIRQCLIFFGVVDSKNVGYSGNVRGLLLFNWFSSKGPVFPLWLGFRLLHTLYLPHQKICRCTGL